MTIYKLNFVFFPSFLLSLAWFLTPGCERFSDEAASSAPSERSRVKLESSDRLQEASSVKQDEEKLSDATRPEFAKLVAELEEWSTDELLSESDRLARLSEPSEEDIHRYSAVLEAMAKSAPDELIIRLAEGIECPLFQIEDRLFSALLDNMEEEDFERKSRQLLGQVSGSRLRALSTALGRALARSEDITKHRGLVVEIGEGAHAAEVLSAVAMAAADAKNGNLERLFKIDGLSEDRLNAMKIALAVNIAETDPQRAIAMLRNNPVASASGFIGEILSGQLTAGGSINDILKTFDSLTPAEVLASVQHPYFKDLLKQAENVALTEELLRRLPLGNDSVGVFEELLGPLSEVNRSAALEILGELPESSVRSRIIGSLIDPGSLRTTQAALSAVESFPQSLRDAALRSIVDQTAVAGRVETLEALLLHVPEGSRTSVRASAIDAVSKSFPEKAAGLVENGLASGLVDHEAAAAPVKSISFRFALQDLDRARSWYEGLPKSLHASAVSGWFPVYLKRDLAGASEWAVAQTDVEVSKVVAREIISQTASIDPAAARNWKARLEALESGGSASR